MTVSLDNVSRTEQGYLTDWQDWTIEIAMLLAQEEQLTLTAHHVAILYQLRDFYSQYQNFPPIRKLVKWLSSQYPNETISSTTLQQLFPQGPLKQASKLAGLPKPARCI